MTTCDCGKEFKDTKTGDRKYALHRSLEHDAYRDGQDIWQATIDALEKKEDQTMFMLIKFPETRLEDNGDLFAKASQYFIRDTLWDSNQQGYVFNREKGVMPHQARRWALAQLEGYRRSRQKLQHRDRKIYHDKAGNTIAEHKCVLSSEAHQHQAQIQEEASHSYYSPRRERA